MPNAPVPAAAVPWGTYVVGAAFLSIALAIPALAFLYFHDLFPFVVMAGPAWAGLGYGLLMRSSAARSLAIGWLTMGLVCTSVFLLFVVTMRSELAAFVVLAVVVGLWLLYYLRRPEVRAAFAWGGSPYPSRPVSSSINVAGVVFLFIAFAGPAFALLYVSEVFPFLVMSGPVWAGLGYGLLMRSSAAQTLAVGWLSVGLISMSVILLFALERESELAPLVVLAIVVGLWLLHGLRRPDVEVVHAGDVGSGSSPAAGDVSLCTIPDGPPENPYNDHDD